MNQIIQSIAGRISSRSGRMIIGISGHGAAGKTTFAHELIKLLGRENVNYLNTDPYIIGSDLRKYTTISYEHEGEQYQGKMTACHPAAHHRAALERDVQMLRAGLELYTMGTHYQQSELMSPRNTINIIEGMSVAFIDPGLYDLTIYMYTDGGTELARRGIRDVAERGTELEYLLKSHQQRRSQYELFMHPLHAGFDLVIRSTNDGCIVEKDAAKGLPQK
ncbi:phosphoribulokinase [Paenibacillus sp. MMS20-IR301]|uniref:uridine kinase family protein n=1 Tax=Paenibacillus sp. MMS20-IR301 TaxID=2895946 RepID=UPI0028E4A334|nr:phosphoribulokinase [Paenibacillus sp. MMS20-IR301]WNS46510.1 phosphoribulokinase [Paenibacillus sp. MMS20-IR301]